MGGRRRGKIYWSEMTPKEKMMTITFGVIGLSCFGAFFCVIAIIFGIVFISLGIESAEFINKISPVIEDWNNIEKANFESSFPDSSLTVQWILQNAQLSTSSTSFITRTTESDYSSKFSGLEWDSYYLESLTISPTASSKDAKVKITIIQNGNVYSKSTLFIDLIDSKGNGGLFKYCSLDSITVLIPENGNIANNDLEIHEIKYSDYDCDYNDWGDLRISFDVYVKSANDPEVFIEELNKNGEESSTITVNGDSQSLSPETSIILAVVAFLIAGGIILLIVIGIIVIVIIWIVFSKVTANLVKSENDEMMHQSEFNNNTVPQQQPQMINQQQGMMMNQPQSNYFQPNFQPLNSNQGVNWVPTKNRMQNPNGMIQQQNGMEM